MITPAQRILLEAAQDRINRLEKTIQRHERERAYFERELAICRGQIKSLQKEIEQREDERSL
jgi:hypothetical protein